MKTVFPDDLVSKLSQLGDKTDAICEKVLQAGAEVVEARVASNLRDSVGKVNDPAKCPSRSTGELADALGVSPVKIDRQGNSNIKIGFREPRRDGGSNAKIANILEYGKHGQPPRPFLKSAKTASRKPATEAMVAKFEEEIGNL